MGRTKTGESLTIRGLKTGGTSWTNYEYAPDGRLLATENNNGGVIKMFVPLPTATAVYNNQGTLTQYRRHDWEGSVRLTSTPIKTFSFDTAYAAFGEPYSTFGTGPQYAGLTSDISSGTEQVSLSRRYHPTQGRWVSPDRIIPDLFNPQSFNSYAYVTNNPLSYTDPTGLSHGAGGNGGALCDQCDPMFLPMIDVMGGGVIGNQCDATVGCTPCAMCGASGFGFSFGFTPGSGSGIWNEWQPPIATSPGQALQSLWSDALGLPTQPCSTALGPWCNGQDLVNPAMDAEKLPSVPRPPNPILQYDQCATQVRNQAAQSAHTIEIINGVSMENGFLGCLGTGPLIGGCEAAMGIVTLSTTGVIWLGEQDSIWEGETGCLQGR
jgi:RHS repeat-associated protein